MLIKSLQQARGVISDQVSEGSKQKAVDQKIESRNQKAEGRF